MASVASQTRDVDSPGHLFSPFVYKYPRMSIVIYVLVSHLQCTSPYILYIHIAEESDADHGLCGCCHCVHWLCSSNS